MMPDLSEILSKIGSMPSDFSVLAQMYIVCLHLLKSLVKVQMPYVGICYTQQKHHAYLTLHK